MNQKPSIPSSWNTNQSNVLVNTAVASTILTIPDELTASENTQRYQFAPTITNLSPVKAALTFAITSNVPTNPFGRLRLTGNGNTIFLQGSSAPSFDQFFTNNGNTLDERTQVAFSIATELTNNLAFNASYETVANGTTITITARDFGPTFDITVLQIPSGATLISNVGGTTQYLYNGLLDYSTAIEVYSGYAEYGLGADRSDFNLIGNIDIPFTSNVANINIADFTKAHLDIELPEKRNNVGISVKELDQEAINAGRNPILRPYFVLYSDSFRYSNNGEKKKRLNGVSAIRWVQNAAFHPLNAYLLSDYVWDASSTQAFKWLTERPNEAPVTYDSHQYLGVIHKKDPKATGVFRIDVIVKFVDGTTSTLSYGNFPYAGLNGNLSFDVSPRVLGVEAEEMNQGVLVDSYSVQLFWTRTPTGVFYASEQKTYKIFRRCGDNSNNIIWFNERGAWDSLEFFGTKSVGLQREVSAINRTLPFNANQRLGRLSPAASEEVSVINKVNSADITALTSHLLPINQVEWSKGLLNSTAVFRWDNRVARYVAIRIDSFEYGYNTETSEFSIRINYTETVPNNTISR